MAAHHRFQRTAHGLGDFLVILVLQSVQMLVDQHDGVVNRFQFRGLMAVAVLALQPLQILQLRQKAFPQVAGADANRIHLLHQVNGFAQGIAAERNACGLGARWHQGRTG